MTTRAYPGLVLPVLLLTLSPARLGSSPAAHRHRLAQLTHGPAEHFFGYDGHQQTYPWSGDGRHILALETNLHERMPRGWADAATILLIDAASGRARPVAVTHAWNFQQGTMLYWNPEHPSEEFFFNDRRPDNRVFTVLYNIRTGARREFAFPDISIANGGVAQNGGRFLAFNYGRVFRPVISYPGAYNFTSGQGHPDNDGLFVVDVHTGRASLIVSYDQIYRLLADRFPELSRPARGIYNQLFINHTYWNRSDDRIWFVARWYREDSSTEYYTEGFTVRPDGSELVHSPIKLSHPDWERGAHILSGGLPMTDAAGDTVRRHVIYDTVEHRVLEVLGPDFFHGAGEPALSPDLRYVASTEGSSDERGKIRRVVVFDRQERTGFRLPFMSVVHRGPAGKDDPLRIDMPPRWNRDGTQLLFEAVDETDGTRQIFVAHLDLAPAGS